MKRARWFLAALAGVLAIVGVFIAAPDNAVAVYWQQTLRNVHVLGQMLVEDDAEFDDTVNFDGTVDHDGTANFDQNVTTTDTVSGTNRFLWTGPGAVSGAWTFSGTFGSSGVGTISQNWTFNDTTTMSSRFVASGTNVLSGANTLSGATTISGTTIVSNLITSNDSANFSGVLQKGGVTVDASAAEIDQLDYGYAYKVLYDSCGMINLNAAKTLLADLTGRTIYVDWYRIEAIGDSTVGCDSVKVGITTAAAGMSGVVVAISGAQLISTGRTISSSEVVAAGNTIGTLGTALTAGQGLKFYKVGGSATSDTGYWKLAIGYHVSGP